MQIPAWEQRYRATFINALKPILKEWYTGYLYRDHHEYIKSCHGTTEHRNIHIRITTYETMEYKNIHSFI